MDPKSIPFRDVEACSIRPSVTSEAAPKGPGAPGPTLGRAFFESLDGAPTWAEAPRRPEAGLGLWGDTWKGRRVDDTHPGILTCHKRVLT